jgi:hypothetical protein
MTKKRISRLFTALSKFNEVLKSQFPLPWREGIKGRGILHAVIDYLSPSPQPSPIEGEGTFWTFYDFIKTYNSKLKIMFFYAVLISLQNII